MSPWESDDVESPGICDPMWSCILQDYEEEDEGSWVLSALGGPYERFRDWKKKRADAEKLRREQRPQEENLNKPIGWERVRSIDLSRVRSYRPFRRQKK